MAYLECGIRQEGDFPFEGTLVLRQRLLRICRLFLCFLLLFLFFLLLALHLCPTLGTVKLIVYLLQERHMVVEFHQVKVTVQCQFALGIDSISIRVALLILCTALPRIVGIVRGIAVHPVEDRQQIERHLVGCLEILTVVERCTPVADAGPYGVLPGMILVGIKILVDRCIWFLYLCMGSTLEVHVQVLGQIPVDGELTVPEELFTEGERQLGVYSGSSTHQGFHIALLQLVVVARHLGIEGYVLRQPVQSETFQYVEPLALVLQSLEWFPCLINRAPRIIQGSAPVVLALIHRRFTRSILMLMTVGE